MKFKIGDKVVLKSGCTWANGDKYRTIDKVMNDGYFVNNNLFVWEEYELELYKEDKEMNSKTFTEVIRDIKIGEVWILRDFRIERTEEGIFIRFENEEAGDLCGIYFEDDEKFTLQRKGISFNDAFVKFWEGVEIESYNGNTFKYNSITTQVTLGNNKSNLAKVTTLLDGIFSAIELKNQWYIVD